jgi:hypothetical protein
MRRLLAILVLCAGCGNDEHVDADAPVAVADAPPGPDGTTVDAGAPDATPADAPSYTYGAALLAGGLDRLVIYRGGGGECVHLRLVSPDIGGTFPNITTPAMWSVESGLAALAGTCTSATPASGEDATDGTGTVTFGTTSPVGYPCTVDLDVTLTFPSGPETMSAQDITVEDSGC